MLAQCITTQSFDELKPEEVRRDRATPDTLSFSLALIYARLRMRAAEARKGNPLPLPDALTVGVADKAGPSLSPAKSRRGGGTGTLQIGEVKRYAPQENKPLDNGQTMASGG